MKVLALLSTPARRGLVLAVPAATVAGPVGEHLPGQGGQGAARDDPLGNASHGTSSLCSCHRGLLPPCPNYTALRSEVQGVNRWNTTRIEPPASAPPGRTTAPAGAGRRVTGVSPAGRVLGGGATAPGWKRPAVPARVRPSPATVRTRPQRRDRVDITISQAVGLAGLLRHLLPEHLPFLAGEARSQGGGGGRDQAQGTSRQGPQGQGNGPEGERVGQLYRSPDPGRRRPCGCPRSVVLAAGLGDPSGVAAE